MELSELIKAAKGEILADTVLKNGTVVNVLSGTLVKGDVAVLGDTVVGIGKYEGRKEVDCTGQFILPGFIDSHVHIESTMLSPQEFVRSVIVHGTTTIVTDPHEIANVCGLKGVDFIVKELSKTPMNALVMMPSCVPCTSLESNGAVIDSKLIKLRIKDNNCAGLAEFMNVPGVIGCDGECLEKIKAALDTGKPIDGHIVGFGGNDLNAYYVTGIKTNHECITVEDMNENIERGCYVQIRHGSYGKNAETLVKGITQGNKRRCLFCTDDKHADEVRLGGHINENIRIAVAGGVNPIDAVSIATVNAAECYGLERRGAVAPSYVADIAVVDNLSDFNVKKVFAAGKLVAENGFPLFKCEPADVHSVINTVHIKPVAADDFAGGAANNNCAIEHNCAKILTGRGKAGSKSLKIAVIERHKATGNIGIGFINGFPLNKGAIAQTVAHDSHNIIVIGANDDDMAAAVNELAKINGGIVIVNDGKVLEKLPLPVAGLMSEITSGELIMRLTSLAKHARTLGCSDGFNAFMELSFLALPVIPELRITDKGLFDVTKFKLV